jgi:hypothetical protein
LARKADMVASPLPLLICGAAEDIFLVNPLLLMVL